MTTIQEDMQTLLDAVDSALEYDTGRRVAHMMEVTMSLLKKHLGREPLGWGSATAGIGWRGGAEIAPKDPKALRKHLLPPPRSRPSPSDDPQTPPVS